MTTHDLQLSEDDVDVLSCALLTAIDDLEARATLCSRFTSELATASAQEYRADARRLRTVLDAIAPGHRQPDPERVAVTWIDGTWSIVNGRPVQLLPVDVLERLLPTTRQARHRLAPQCQPAPGPVVDRGPEPC